MENFEKIVSRSNCGSLKLAMTPEILRQKNIASFAGAELDFPCAPCISEAIIKAAQNGLYGFTLADDLYYERIIGWMKNVRQTQLKRDFIVPTYGTIHSLATLIKAFSEKGQNVIVQSPYYSRYRQAAQRLGRGTLVNPMVIENNRYVMDLTHLENLMRNPDNRILVFSNPNNPSGTIFDAEELLKVKELSEKYHVVVFSDEIFAENTLTEKTVPCYAMLTENNPYGVSCTSLGKSFSCTGFNHANVIIQDEKLKEAFVTQRTSDHFGSIDPLVYQAVVAGYSEEGKQWIDSVNALIKENSKLVHQTMNELGCNVLNNEGSFVLWIDFSRFGKENELLEQFLLEKALFHIDPGNDYGDNTPMYARMSLGSTKKQVQDAMQRMKDVFN